MNGNERKSKITVQHCSSATRPPLPHPYISEFKYISKLIKTLDCSYYPPGYTPGYAPGYAPGYTFFPQAIRLKYSDPGLTRSSPLTRPTTRNNNEANANWLMVICVCI